MPMADIQLVGSCTAERLPILAGKPAGGAGSGGDHFGSAGVLAHAEAIEWRPAQRKLLGNWRQFREIMCAVRALDVNSANECVTFKQKIGYCIFIKHDDVATVPC